MAILAGVNNFGIVQDYLVRLLKIMIFLSFLSQSVFYFTQKTKHQLRLK